MKKKKYKTKKKVKKTIRTNAVMFMAAMVRIVAIYRFSTMVEIIIIISVTMERVGGTANA